VQQCLVTRHLVRVRVRMRVEVRIRVGVRVRVRIRVRVRVRVKVRITHQVRQLLGRAHASTTLGERHARHLEALEIMIALEIATAAADATAAAATTVNGPTSIACVPHAPTPHLVHQRAQLHLGRRHAVTAAAAAAAPPTHLRPRPQQQRRHRATQVMHLGVIPRWVERWRGGGVKG
jgi:hypothetical protein